MEAVIFDMDGVIFDSERLIYKIWQSTGPEFGFHELDEVFYKVLGTSMEYTRQVFTEEFGQDIPYEEFRDEARKRFFEHVEKYGMPVKTGVREILEYLQKRAVKVGLASSTSIATVTRELKLAGLYDYFDAVIGGDLLKRSKPHPDIYIMACGALGVKEENAFAIEDSYNGMRAAHSAGMMAIMVPDMAEATEEMRQIAYAVKNDLNEVREMFCRI